jgi:FixJ family two-component response regulator
MDLTMNAIAIVEDDAAVRAALARFLRVLGFDTLSYESAEAFIGSNSTQDLVCILMDQNLPGISGLELSEYLRTREINIPQVLITGRDEQSVRQKCKEAGMPLVIKPAHVATLNRAISAAIATPHPKL